MEKLVIIGGGIIGLATALKAAKLGRAKDIVVIEKDREAGAHQSSHNSGVLHCGLYYLPGSLKAQMAVAGIREMKQFCQENNIPHDICGKVVVAVTDNEVERLRELQARGTANGLTGLRWLSGEETKEIEPHVVAKASLHVPEEGIVDYAAVMKSMVAEICKLGHEVKTDTACLSISTREGKQIVETSRGVLVADQIINCAGLHCDRVAKASGFAPNSRIIPFRGDYWKLSKTGERLVKHLIYPVPDPTLPFLGVHFTRMIQGGAEAGPNAVLAFKREGYGRFDFSLKDTFDTFTWPGLYQFLKRYPGTTWNELKNSFSKHVFLQNLQRLIPEITMDDLQPDGGSGVRAQAIHRNGSILLDFAFEKKQGQLHLLNAPSPGATASLAIGEHLLNQILE